MTQDIAKLPNIGHSLATRLESAGIENAETLAKLGSVEATMQLEGLGENACYNTLYALEGAIRGIRWHAIPKADREVLKRSFDTARAKRHSLSEPPR